MLRYFIKIIFILSSCLAINACAQSGSVPTVLSTAPATVIPTNSETPPPTHTPTATIMPYPTLSAKKPYLMMQQDKQALIEYDADGLGRMVIELPSDGHIPFFPGLDGIVSPDGKWLVFYTGNLGREDTLENLPVTLNLLNLENGNVQKVADVVSEGYADKLEQLADELKKLYPDKYKPVEDFDWVYSSLLSAFTWSIPSVSWSPDGHMLAFAAQADELSSDVYLYDLDTGTVKQIESSIQNVSSIFWSPDGKYIVFENSEPGNVYTGASLYAVQPGDQVIDSPKMLYSGTWLHVGNWLSPNLLLVADGTDTAGIFNLQNLDIHTGKLRPLWKDSVSNYAVDPINKIIALNTGEFTEPDNFGVYFITFSGRQSKILEGLYWATLFFRGGEEHRFLMQGESETSIKSSFPISGDVVGLRKDGKPMSIGQFAYDKISISPDSSWLLMFDGTGLYIYDKNDNLAQKLPIKGIRKVAWRPDSQAIFYSDGKALYILAIPSGEQRLVDECEQSNCSLDDIVWLP